MKGVRWTGARVNILILGGRVPVKKRGKNRAGVGGLNPGGTVGGPDQNPPTASLHTAQ